jgi:CO/xanthine dehydrogenase Mo-binding subunit
MGNLCSKACFKATTYGAKGVGEIAGVPTAPAIINAIDNAVGVRVDQLPVDHEFVWRSMKKRLIKRDFLINIIM